MAVDAREITVTGPAGGKFTVMTETERDLFDDLCARYTSDNKFQNISDLQDLERIINLEVLHLRYANWMSTETDYFGETIDIKIIGNTLKEFSGELRQLKKQVGIDRTSRQRDTAESLVDYIENLKVRAKKFGIMREEQMSTGIMLVQDLIALITLHDNCTPEERVQQHCRDSDVIQWIREVFIPEFQEVDKHFIDSEQRYWIQEQ